MKKRGIIFDLDGTLLDTLEDIAISVNYVLSLYEKEPIGLQEFRYLVGQGALQLMQDALGVDEVEAKKALKKFEEHYATQYSKNTKLYDGIGKLLSFLQKRDYKMAILSNKPDSFTKLCAVKYLRDWKFEAVYGIREGVEKKPSAEGAFEILEKLGLNPQETLFMGDTKIDMITAKNAGIDAIGVLWGFREKSELVEFGARHIVSSPKDAIKLIGGL